MHETRLSGRASRRVAQPDGSDVTVVIRQITTVPPPAGAKRARHRSKAELSNVVAACINNATETQQSMRGDVVIGIF